MYRIHQIKLKLGEPVGSLPQKILKKLGSDGKDVKEYVAALNAFLENEKIKEYSETVSDEIKTVESKAAEQFYDKFVDIVDEMQVALKNTTFSLYEFSETLKGVFENVKVALVPMYLDSVYVGQSNESFFDGIKIMYVCGAVEGLVPRILEKGFSSMISSYSR